jgi:predicted transcriptional regulator
MGRRSSKRSKTDLYAEVLEVVTHYPEGARITKLSYGVGVPVDRLKLIIDRLCSYGLANKSEDEEGAYYGITPRGLEFLDIFWKMKGFLEEFGEKSQA